MLAAGARTRSPECVPLQVSRLLEERVAEAEGIKDVRHWLSLIGICAARSVLQLLCKKLWIVCCVPLFQLL